MASHNAVHAVDCVCTVRRGKAGEGTDLVTIPRALFMSGDLAAIRRKLMRRFGSVVHEEAGEDWAKFRLARKPNPRYVPADTVVLTRAVVRMNALWDGRYVHAALDGEEV